VAKIAIVVLSSTENPEAHGRLIHALHAGKEMKAAGNEVKLLFEGIGVTWLQAFHTKEHPVVKGYGYLFEDLRPEIMGTCNFCTNQRFQVHEDAAALGIPLLGGEGEHFSLGTLVADGYQIITY
jgi:hypothetical protein